MKKYGVNELRRMFLAFFEGKDHLVMKSFSLVPHNDKSLLLINAGMAPLKPYFTGQEIPPRKRVATCQKCIRTGDIENVGKTARHGTFFEMLGNFSFGDYFKREAIAWTWEFLTEVVGLEKDRLYPSVYLEDEEAFSIWRDEIGIPEERIFKFGKEDNFWEHGAGPCGPCSEVYFDRGEEYGCGKPGCTVGCDCDRYMEVWNDVFTQFDGDGKGNYTELDNKNIDTGMGLERLAVAVQGVDSIFDVDTVQAVRNAVCQAASLEYKKDEEKDVSIRLITDHIRSATFMISDGILPSNEGRGYVLRRLIRRAARHGRLLGIQGKFLASLSEVVIRESRDGYPELEEKKLFIKKVLTQEEDKFDKTIDQGLSILAEMEDTMEKSGEKTLAGRDVFKLYDTYGFPMDLTKEILNEKGLEVDEKGFHAAMEEQRKKARDAREVTNYMGADATVYESIDLSVTSQFVGYENQEYDSEITVMTTETEIVEALTDGQAGTIFVKETPFYATSGGQTADTGMISFGENEFVVEDTLKLPGGKIGHVGKVARGMFKTGDQVHLSIDAKKRLASGKNHSATHLLQQALRDVLGEHVEQAGSLVTPERLRFDFTHFAPMTPEEIQQVEDIVNRKINAFLPVHTKTMPIDEAKKTGARALFGEKYGAKVRVVNMGGYSIELCGGTHVDNTGSIAAFKILSESGIAAGVRRIEALTADGLFAYYSGLENTLSEAARLVKAAPDNLLAKLKHLTEELKEVHSENEMLKSKLAKEALGDVMEQAEELGGLKVLASKVDNVDMNGLRELGDQLKEKLIDGVIILASHKGGRVSLMAMATDSAVKAGVHCGRLIKESAALVGGGGGGRPNMAQAGGKNPAGMEDALKKALEIVKSQIA